MGELSSIEWTDHTFNPWIGCTKVSPGCQNCYAECESRRRGWARWGSGNPRQRTSPANWKQPLKWNKEACESGRRKRVFCASLADVFDAEVDAQWRTDLWDLIRNTRYLDWLILTKRPENISGMLPPDWKDGWPNVCLMTSVEDQARAARVEHLVSVPARYRALSIEPLLGPVVLDSSWMGKLDWIIVGGESQKGARPMHPAWVHSIREQCYQHGVQFFFKQWGCWSPDEKAADRGWSNAAYFESPSEKAMFLKDMDLEKRHRLRSDSNEGVFLFRTSKGKSGDLLNGKQYHAHPFGKQISKKEIIQPLSREEKGQLKKHEVTIQKGLHSFIEVGAALTEIRNSHLYRETHATFEEYVQAVLALSRPYAYGLIEASAVMHDLSSIEDMPLPTNEAQARELKHLKTPQERVKKWREVVGSNQGQSITAKMIRAIVRPKASDVHPVNEFQTCLARLESLVARAGVYDDAIPLIQCLQQIVERKAVTFKTSA